MTIEQVKKTCTTYKKNFFPVSEYCADIKNSELSIKITIEIIKKHCGYMCDKIISGELDTNPEKIMRWLGFVQGCLWTSGLCSIAEMKNDNR